MKSRLLCLLLLLVVILLFAGCAPGTGRYTAARPATALDGIWHGWIAPVTLIIGVVDESVRIYEPFNSGWWYDLGFYVAVIAGFGGLSLSRRKRD